MNSEFHILNLSGYQTPEIYEDPNSEFVGYGDNNNFYSEIIDAYLNSPTTNSIITGVVGQIYGRGFSALDASRRPDEFAAFKTLFKAKDLKRICLDYKLLGEAAIQVTYSGKKIASVSHFNRETLRAEKCDDKGKINAYYYCPKWAEYKQGDKLTRIPVFGSGATNEIYIIRKFIPSMHYYSPPDWVSALNYSKLECDISQYLVNEVTNSFSGTKLVSFTNGVPTQEKQQMIKNEILNKLTGENGEKVIVSFSDSPENKTTIEDISVSDAADVYSYISEEATKKLLLANRITSPLLVGIRDNNNGLGSNSEEIENAHNLFDNVVIRPYQNDIIDAIDEILAVNGIALKIYVQTLTPIEFTNEELVTKEQKEEETGQKLSLSIEIDGRNAYETKEEAEAVAKTMGCEGSHEHELDGKIYFMPCETHELKEPCWDGYEMIGYKTDKNGKKVPNCVPIEAKKEAPKMSDELVDQILGALQGETMEDYELVEQRAYNEKNTEFEQIKLAETVKAKPSKESRLDKGVYKVRYSYEGNKEPQREFCKAMMKRTAKGVVYRLEDIDKASVEGVNGSFAHDGKSYDLFKWKGGIYCNHYWEERLYRLKKKDGKYVEDKALSSSEEVSTIPKSYKPSPVGNKLAPVKPINMPNRGKYPG